ncbi:MAG: hypothetical protein Sylvanvirus41_1, partial [Sylvanvirus sp.]
TVVDDQQVLADTRHVILMDMYVRWTSIGLNQLGSSAIKLQTDSQDPTYRRPIHYYLLSFPIDLVHGIVDRTNAKILSTTGRQTRLTVQYFFKLLGILYLMALYELPNRRSYWLPQHSKAFPSPNFGRFMEISFFEHFLQHISWSAANNNDRWASVRDMFNGFNTRKGSNNCPF